jgi:predicted metal-dependent hydrolase
MERKYPEAYIAFLAHFHGDRDYFECHELLEEYWKEHPQSPYRHTWVCLIQSAVGMYHYRRGNIAGARKSLEGSLRLFRALELSELGINAMVWRERLTAVLAGLQSVDEIPYQDINIPLTDVLLLHAVLRECERMGVEWEAPSRMEERGLIHRHTLRDRSDVIEARLDALAARRAGH